MKFFFRWIALFVCLFSCGAEEYDVTVIGRVINADGLCRIPITFIDMLKDDLNINHIQTFGDINTNGIKDDVKQILRNPDKTPGRVSILVDALGTPESPSHRYVPESKIKLAYSMWESNRIPSAWVEILNKHFDAVIVPDSFLIDCYKDSGVTIPIFELPLCLYLDDFFAKPPRVRPGKPFVIGCTASGLSHKNQTLLIRAFAEEFGNTDEVILSLSSRWVVPDILKRWKRLINQYGCQNIIVTVKSFSNQEYLDNMDTFDCYVNISKGEGFSIGPREALSLRIPSILTNNSAQKTICRTGLVRVVPSEIPEPPPENYSIFGPGDFGFFYNCYLEDVKAALRDVYENYDLYLEQANKGPEWVSQYRMQNLKGKYLTLVKPKKIILGNKNEITDDYIMTSSETLYQKYINVFQ